MRCVCYDRDSPFDIMRLQRAFHDRLEHRSTQERFLPTETHRQASRFRDKRVDLFKLPLNKVWLRTDAALRWMSGRSVIYNFEASFSRVMIRFAYVICTVRAWDGSALEHLDSMRARS